MIMLLVVDTNIIISSLIKDSVTRETLLCADIRFITPEWVHTEIMKHYDYIAKKAGLTKSELIQFIDEMFTIVQVIPFDKYKSHIKTGLKAMGKIDKDDAPFIAIAIAYGADGIWSNDKDFKRQNVVKIWKTKDLMEKRNE